MPIGIYSGLECTETHGSFTPQAHQKFVKDYFVKTPFKGLLLYHRLGSGKTCSSIIIGDALLELAEIEVGSKNTAGFVVMIPSSLQITIPLSPITIT